MNCPKCKYPCHRDEVDLWACNGCGWCEDWPNDKKPTPSQPLSDEAEDWINAEIDVAVAEIEARIGPHPATKEYAAWPKAKSKNTESRWRQAGSLVSRLTGLSEDYGSRSVAAALVAPCHLELPSPLTLPGE